MHWSGGHWVWGTLMMLVLLVSAIALIAMLLRAPRAHSQDHDPRSPLEILEQRFARGEIGEEEFAERSKILRHRPA